MGAIATLDTLSTIDQVERFLDGNEICQQQDAFKQRRALPVADFEDQSQNLKSAFRQKIEAKLVSLS